MGYTTDFTGSFTVTPPLNEDEVSYLRDFNNTRRMDRKNGPYFVKGTGFAGQGSDDDIRDYNRAPEGQPGLWCQWVPSPGGSEIEWDGGEKFYHSAEWIKYLIDHFLADHAPMASDPTARDQDGRFARFTFDHVVNGTVEAQGEDPDDRWRIVITDNVVRRQDAVIAFGDPQEV